MLKTSNGQNVFSLTQPMVFLDDAKLAIFHLENALLIVDKIGYSLAGV